MIPASVHAEGKKENQTMSADRTDILVSLYLDQ
jgi:hypothetical protein